MHMYELCMHVLTVMVTVETKCGIILSSHATANHKVIALVLTVLFDEYRNIMPNALITYRWIDVWHVWQSM